MSAASFSSTDKADYRVLRRAVTITFHRMFPDLEGRLSPKAATEVVNMLLSKVLSPVVRCASASAAEAGREKIQIADMTKAVQTIVPGELQQFAVRAGLSSTHLSCGPSCSACIKKHGHAISVELKEGAKKGEQGFTDEDIISDIECVSDEDMDAEEDECKE